MAFIMVFSLVACGADNKQEEAETIAETIAETVDERITVPDIDDTDETTAKNLLSSNGLIPKIEYEFDDDTEQGNVIRTSPLTGTKVEKNSKVTVYISKGSSYIEAKNAGMSWYNISADKDQWNIYNPYIKEETLFVDCEATFSCPLKWIHNQGIGYASITDTFDKAVPINADFEKQSINANEMQHMTFKIPLGDLNVSKPTDMYLRLYGYVDGSDQQQEIRISFFITW